MQYMELREPAELFLFYLWICLFVTFCYVKAPLKAALQAFFKKSFGRTKGKHFLLTETIQ